VETGMIDMAEALGSVASGVLQQISGVLPVVLPIFGAVLAIGIGLKVFKKITAKS
jgi:hypothetical protein